MSAKKQPKILTDYPPDLIDQFVTWLTDHGYNYEEVFKSSLETQNYYFKRFLNDTGNQQLSLNL